MSSFTHLHATSGYSARYGAAHVDHLVRRAAERGMGALALTDRDNVTGAVRFANACDARGVRPIFGVDIAVAPHYEAPIGAQLRRRTPVRGGAHVVEAPLRVTLLAQNADGWARLCRLISAAYADPVAGLPVVSWSTLEQHVGEGLTVLLGPVSEPVRALTAGREDLSEQLLAPWRDLAGDNLRMEVVWFGLQGTGPGSLRLAGRTLALADRLAIPTVLTNAVRYADRDQHRLADVLDAARLLRPIDRRHLDTGERWLKDTASMTAAAGRIAEAAGAGPSAQQLMAETAGTAARCRVDPVADLGLGTPHFPEPGVVGAGTGPGEAAALLKERCEAGMVRRGLDRDTAAVQRLQEELSVIAGLKYDTYFLTVAAVVADVREMGIRVAARGSGPGRW